MGDVRKERPGQEVERARFAPDSQAQQQEQTGHGQGDAGHATVRGDAPAVRSETWLTREQLLEQSTTQGPPGVVKKENIVFDRQNPNIAKAIPGADYIAVSLQEEAELDQRGAVRGTYPAIVEGSDSERTGTSWGGPGYEGADTVRTPRGPRVEGTGAGEAHPNGNIGRRVEKDPLEDVGSWSTIEKTGSAGSPTGNS